MGYLFAVLAMLSFGALGLLSKLADSRGCSPIATTFSLFAAAIVFLGVYITAFRQYGFAARSSVIGIGILFGAIAMLASWVFLYGLRFGKITTSWVIINLSSLVPAIASTLIYGEAMTGRKLFLLALAITAILFLWKDMQEEVSTEPGALVEKRSGESN